MSKHSESWAKEGEGVTRLVVEATNRCLEAYRANPILIQEHANIERHITEGGYGRRQIYELVQNAADQMLDGSSGRIHVLLTNDALYCANQGEPIEGPGVETLLQSHISAKGGAAIGRFGLGFKSVLAVSERPEFYSRSGSFRWDPSKARKLIGAIAPETQRVPLLRTAFPADAGAAAAADPVLRELMGWATTVVKLPIDGKRPDWVAEDVEDFPAVFMLFCEHVGEILLEHRARGRERHIVTVRNHDVVDLTEDGTSVRWLVLKKRHALSTNARADSAALGERDFVPLIWAVPVERGRQTRGSFWAFFPTEYRTTLSGILNAPWKTNEDRQHLQPGPLNYEMIRAAAELIVESLPRLASDDDPAAFLELLPARGREAPQWADECLTRDVYAVAAERPSLPDLSGALQRPSKITLPPDGVSLAGLQAWEASYPRVDVWCHGSVNATTSRRSRAERLVEDGGGTVADVRRWLEDRAAEGTPASSSAAILAAGSLDGRLREEAVDSAFVLTADGRVVSPDPDSVFLARSENCALDEVSVVHPTLAEDPHVRVVLTRYGLTELDPIAEFRAMVARWNDGWTAAEWEQFWRVAGGLRSDSALEVLNESRSDISAKVLNLEGEFVPITRTLLGGSIVSGRRTDNPNCTIDSAFHHAGSGLLKALGAASAPRPDPRVSCEGWLPTYEDEVADAWRERRGQDGGYVPARSKVEVRRGPVAGPLEVLRFLDESGKARYTAALLGCVEQLVPWTVAHKTVKKYPEEDAINPVLWCIKRWGRLGTSLAAAPVSEAVGPALGDYRTFLPVAEIAAGFAMTLGLPSEPAEVSVEIWVQGIDRAADRGEACLGRAAVAACRAEIDPPSTLPGFLGGVWTRRLRSEVAVADDRQVGEHLELAEQPYLLVESDEERFLLCERWGLKDGRTCVQVDVMPVGPGGASGVSDKFRGLRMLLPGDKRSLELVPCESLSVKTTTPAGYVSEERDVYRHGDVLYYRGDLDDRAVLEQVNLSLGLGLSSDDQRQVLEQRDKDRHLEREKRIRDSRDDVERLTRMFPRDELSRGLPSSLNLAAATSGVDVAHDELARCALAVHGVGVLKAYRGALERRGFEPPSRWKGSTAALEFVHRLGFEPAYAGFPGERRDPLVRVPGPIKLPPLHDFQEKASADIQSLLASGHGRGLLSLPTGAGKTRVAVDALLHWLREPRDGPLLWIAQSDELCEQAVQAWSDSWRALGARTDLLVSRLWAANAAESMGSERHVVVATVQKLSSVLDRPEYAWLRTPACVLIDEAHGAVARQYSGVLQQVGLGGSNEACPLIGLTATPFRGRSESETARLVLRFAGRRFDFDAFEDDPYAELQRRGVLAHVEHRLVDGIEIRLDPDELAHLNKLKRLPTSVEAKVGLDVDRNLAIVKSICELPPESTVLVFAPSVDNAKTLAALLTMRGVPARAVTGETDQSIRRHYVEKFRSGELRVLTNCAVFTEGFDAPAVSAVYVARPTFSPNLYQQMIGRGLRGPLNGGKAVCLIVNVEDNIAQYGEELAFRGFDYLWEPDREPSG